MLAKKNCKVWLGHSWATVASPHPVSFSLRPKAAKKKRDGIRDPGESLLIVNVTQHWESSACPAPFFQHLCPKLVFLGLKVYIRNSILIMEQMDKDTWTTSRNVFWKCVYMQRMADLVRQFSLWIVMGQILLQLSSWSHLLVAFDADMDFKTKKRRKVYISFSAVC